MTDDRHKEVAKKPHEGDLHTTGSDGTHTTLGMGAGVGLRGTAGLTKADDDPDSYMEAEAECPPDTEPVADKQRVQNEK